MYLMAISLFSFIPIAYAADMIGPTVSIVSPLQATYTIPTLFSVTASDASGVASCKLLVSSVHEAPMTLNATSSRWEVSYTFITIRSANSIRAVCRDTLGNETKGPSKIIPVADAPIATSDVDASTWTHEQIVSTSPALIKTQCPGGEDTTHPCRTVYFLDNVGKRHAFPNEKAYFTWYPDYRNLHIVTSAMMASFPLGKNVTYKPGRKMVKFLSVNTVYIVSAHGILRAVPSEEFAINLVGPTWNQQIDDISEAFYSNYTIGEPANAELQTNYSERWASVISINDNL